MGFYVNPTNGQSKEEWLGTNGRSVCTSYPFAALRVSENGPKYSEKKPGEVWVILVFNGGFSAAAIAYDPREFEAFARKSDVRPKVWFLVPRDKVLEVEPLVKGLL